MSSFRWLAALLALAPAAQAQFTPHIGYVYPAGGRQGGTFEITVGGQYLNGVTEAFISGPGVKTKVMAHFRPLTQRQFNELREQLQQLMTKRAAAVKAGRQSKAATGAGWSAEDEKKIEEMRRKLATFIRRPVAPAIVESVRVQVTLAPNAEPGERELRLGAASGLTNPLVFCVGQLPEFSRRPAKPIDELAQARAARFRAGADGQGPEGPLNVTLPAVLNGQIMPGTVDRFRFKAEKGQRLVVAVSARELVPYISDAVPGWFQATIALLDARGKELRYADDYRFHPDPVLYYEIAEAGEYSLDIKDSIYRGREDFVYRITVGEVPFITSIFPLGGKVGARASIEMKGWNLPAPKLAQKPKEAGVRQISVRKGEWISNSVPFAVDTLAEREEREPNNQARSAPRVKLPLVVNGRIDRPGDVDVFRLEGRAGEEIVAEVFARRLGSPLDSILKLTDASGKQLAVNDDHEDKGSGLLTHHADSRLSARLPANGSYYVQVGDTQRKGGAEYGYRLRITRPQPDFELRVVPSTVNVRAGATVPITVYALRKDGFNGDIALKLKGAPNDFALSGGWVPANQDKVRLTLTVPPSRMDSPIRLHLEGRAGIQGKEVRRPGIPAEDMMQAFAYHHLVPARDWMVRVVGAGRPRMAWKPSDEKPVKLAANAPSRVVVPMPRLQGPVQLALNEPPDGIAIRGVSAVREGVSIQVQVDPAKVKPGLKGNLIVDAYLDRPVNTKTKQAAGRRQPLGTLPAIPFEVVAQ